MANGLFAVMSAGWGKRGSDGNLVTMRGYSVVPHFLCEGHAWLSPWKPVLHYPMAHAQQMLKARRASSQMEDSEAN